MGRRAVGASAGNVYITVDGVSGSEVRGMVFVAVTTPDTQGYYNRDIPFTGVFDGTDLTFGIPPAVWLTVTPTGSHMQGVIKGAQTFGTLSLDRKR